MKSSFLCSLGCLATMGFAFHLSIGQIGISLHGPSNAPQHSLWGQQRCDRTGTNRTVDDEKYYICGDWRLGPKRLPSRLPLLSFVSDYDRFGGLTPAAFLERWTSNGSYIYPEEDGFQLDTDNVPIKGSMMLEVGAKVDRFGGEYGKPSLSCESVHHQSSSLSLSRISV